MVQWFESSRRPRIEPMPRQESELVFSRDARRQLLGWMHSTSGVLWMRLGNF